MKANCFLDGIQINDPNNLEELSIDITYDKDGNKQSSSVNNWVFGVNDQRNTNDALVIINNRLNSGMGVSEGLPFQIYLSDEKTKNYRLYDGYIDLWKAKYLCNEITAPSVEQGQIDWLNDIADSVSYEFLFKQGVFNSNYFIPVPYVINKKQNALDVIVCIVSVFVMTQELYKQTLILIELGVEAANPAQTITAIIKLVLQIAYVVFLLAAIVKLLLDLYYSIIQPIKYHNGMYVLDSIRIACTYLGVNFSSSILESEEFKYMVLIPEKYNINESNTGLAKNVVGYLTGNKNEKEGYYKNTFGELLRSLKLMFNAKIFIDGNTVYFEKQDFNLKNSTYTVPPVVDEGYTLNYDEFYSNVIIRFLTDLNDKNTIQQYTGTSVQITQYPNVVVNSGMQLMRKADDRIIPFARGVRKSEFNFLETIFDAFFNAVGPIIDGLIGALNKVIDIVNKIIEFLNKIIKLLSKVGLKKLLPPTTSIPQIPQIPLTHLDNFISRRKDMLMMEGDYVDVPKLIMVKQQAKSVNNVLLASNETNINAEYLYDNYHYFSNFVTTNGWTNQKKIYTATDIPFTFTDYENVKNNSLCLDSNGNPVTLLNVKFNPIKQIASLSYFKREVYLTNISLTKIIPNG